MIKKLVSGLAALTAILFIGQFALANIQEPLKFNLWTSSEWVLPVFGLMLIILVIFALVTRKIGLSALAIFSLLIGSTSVLFPFIRSEVGMPYPSNIADANSDIEIRVPLSGQVVVAWGGDKIGVNYHAAYADQRWAYDLVMEPHSRSFDKLTDYGCFGKTVFAPLSGEVKTAEDEVQDEPAGSEGTSASTVFGNYVVIQPTGEDTRLIVAHLKSGSILVAEGQIIEEGEPIGQCGNSGSSTEPHVHVHYIELVEDGEDTHMIGLPLYFRGHVGKAMPEGGFKYVKGDQIADGDVISHKGDARE